MHVWQLQEAKARFTKFIKEAHLEPQIIFGRGGNKTVVISMDKYKELVGKKQDIVSFFRNSPLYGIDLDIKRDASTIREIDL